MKTTTLSTNLRKRLFLIPLLACSKPVTFHYNSAGERDVAQRVSQGASQNGGPGGDHSGSAKASRSAYRWLTEGECPNRGEQAGRANGFKSAVKRSTNRGKRSIVFYCKRSAAMCIASRWDRRNLATICAMSRVFTGRIARNFLRRF
jgi:hypothetical protein